MRIVIALGGNALGKNPQEQKNLLKEALVNFIPLIKDDNEIIITHGNGPQVGMINLAFERSANENEIALMPIAECTAMSQGYIGYHIENVLRSILVDETIDKEIVTILTEVDVDPTEEAFSNPTKPIGSFYTKEEADKLSKTTNNVYKEDAGRGYRRVIASPKPLKIHNTNTIDCLLKNNHIVIACGGGGIPISNDEDVNAVIDKDLASSLLAQELNADLFIILTNVDGIMLDYNTDREVMVNKISVDDANAYLDKGYFAKGSMFPKVKAAINFTTNTGNNSIITDLDNIKDLYDGKNCTVIYK